MIAHRRAFRVSAERPHDAHGDPDVGAAGDHRLLGFAAALGVEQFELEAVPAKHAAALPDLGDRGRPIAELPDRELEPILGAGRARQRRGKDERNREYGQGLHLKSEEPP